MDELVESLQKSRLLVDKRPIPAPRGSQVFGRLDAAFYLALSFDHGVAAHVRSRGDGALAAASEHLRAGPCHDTALALVQMWADDLEESRERFRTDLHVLRLLRAF
jgi:hypothetical protein